MGISFRDAEATNPFSSLDWQEGFTGIDTRAQVGKQGG
jgi:hypothetical protein